MALHLGSGAGPVAEPGSLWVAGLTAVFGARRTALVPHHPRALAGLPAAVRAAARAGAGADRVHPHRVGPQERSHRHAVLSGRTRARSPCSRSTTSSGTSAASPTTAVGRRRPGRASRSPRRSRSKGPAGEFEAKKTVKSGEKLSKAKTDMTKAVEKWAIDDGLMVKRNKELWVRVANAVAFILMICAVLPVGLPDHHVGAAVRGVLPVLGGVVERRGRHPAHRRGPRTVVARRRFPPHAGHGFGGDPVRLRGPQGPLHRPTSRSRSRRAPRRCGPRSTRPTPVPLRRSRIGTPRRPRRRAGDSPEARAVRTSTVSSRRCRRRSAPTPRRSRRPRRVAAAASAVAAVGAAAVAEEVAHGEVPADRRADCWRSWC